MLKKIYLSPLVNVISFLQNLIAIVQQPFMVYGFYNSVQKKFMKLTRVSSNVKILSRKNLDMDENVWIGHYSLLDASNGIKIDQGVQTGPYVSVFSHSSHISIRLLGNNYLQSDKRIGYIDGKVEIGAYTFIGTMSAIFPGVTIGKGCLIKAGSVVTKSIPNFSIVSGNPAIVTGNVLDMDTKYFQNEVIQKSYFDQTIIEEWMKTNKDKKNANPLS